MIRMKEQQAFFAGRQQKNAGKEAGRNQKIYQAVRKRHEKHTADKDKSCHLRTVRSPETALSIGYSQGKKQKSPGAG